MRDALLERLAALPCGARLLAAAADMHGVHLVGGAVRDLLLERTPGELDVAVEGDIAPLAARLGAPVTAHARFGTATVRADECRWDLAATRAESYPRPGALPVVRAASIDEDLRRRDVTVNALALDLARGKLRAVPHAREDLAAGRLRVLHDASFSDDPTRLWRIARYAARLGFELEPHTAELAAQAVARGAPETVSGARIGNELRLALGEPDPLAALAAAAALGLAPWLRPDARLAARALAQLPDGEGRPELVILAASLDAPDADARLAALEFTAAERAILAACAAAPRLADVARDAASPSRLARALRGVPVEALALAAAHGAEEPIRRWLHELRGVALAIRGRDLVAAGIEPGPEIGRRLAAVLDARLDGALGDDRDAQLTAALRAGPDPSNS